MSEQERSNKPNLSNQDCETLLALIPAYCLGAVDPEERQWIEARLADCPEAALELEEYQSLHGVLHFAVPQLAPPPGLQASLMAAISTETKPAQPAPPIPQTERRKTLLRPRFAWTVAAAMLVLLVICNVYWLLQMRQLNSERDSLTQQIEDRESLIRALGGGDGRLGRVELADARTNEPPTSSYASLVWSTGATNDTWIALLSAHELPVLDPEMVYQLWLVRGDYRVSAGLFTVNEGGDGQFLFYAEEPIGSFEAIGITPEPMGGSEAPTSPPVVVGQL